MRAFDEGPPQVGARSLSSCEFFGCLVVFLGLPALILGSVFSWRCFSGRKPLCILLIASERQLRIGFAFFRVVLAYYDAPSTGRPIEGEALQNLADAGLCGYTGRLDVRGCLSMGKRCKIQ